MVARKGNRGNQRNQRNRGNQGNRRFLDSFNCLYFFENVLKENIAKISKMIYNKSMKKIALIGFLIVFAFAGFRPPEGMQKFPSGNVQFQLQTSKGSITANVDTSQTEAQSPASQSEVEGK